MSNLQESAASIEARMRSDEELRQISVHSSVYYELAYKFLTEASTPQEQEQHIIALHAASGVVTKAREILDFLNGKDG